MGIENGKSSIQKMGRHVQYVTPTFAGFVHIVNFAIAELFSFFSSPTI